MKYWKSAIMVFLLIYVSSYVVISSYGIYRPAVIGTNGIKWWEWSPLGFVSEGYSDRKIVSISYYPLAVVDRMFWHKSDGAYYGTCDTHINFRGKILNADTMQWK